MKIINLGGDTDTSGAVGSGLGGIIYGVEQISADWLQILKKKTYLKQIEESFFEAISEE